MTVESASTASATGAGRTGAGRERAVRARAGRLIEFVVLAVVAYVPFLLSSRGELSSDTKQYLYLDPGAYSPRTLFLWDPQVGMGTVPHQQIGYLWPMGPYFWLMDALGAPDWVAQRLWLGTISFAAGLGALWLFRRLGVRRVGALAGAFVYMLTPYQLAFTARISVILLAWAGLPWLVGLAMRAARRGGWTDPALFALVVLTIGGVNASSLLLVGIAPLIWLAIEATRGRAVARAVGGAVLRIGVLTGATSLWWIVALRIQGRYGLPVLQLTESLRTVSGASDPTDLLRGLGNWFFYGFDAIGYSIDQARYYVDNGGVIAATFAIPVLALTAAAVLRWRYRAHFAALVVVGTVIGVGAWPYDDPSPYGSLFKTFANDSSIGLAFRNTARVAPVIVLGLAGLLAAAVSALATWRPSARWHLPHAATPKRVAVVSGILVVLVAFAALAPVWKIGFMSEGVSRPETLPAYWTDAAAALDAQSHDTRILEIPGADFAGYRWGNAIEPVTPGLTDRPYVAREVLPYGTPPSVNMLVALDNRMQEGTFDPATLAAYARLIGAGTVVLRSDLAFERFDTPRPRMLWDLLTDPVPIGLRAPVAFGDPVPNPPPPALPIIDELELGTPESAGDPPPVVLFDVENAVPIVHSAPSEQPVVITADADGILDAIAAGLLDGRQLVLQTGSLDVTQLREALGANADLVLTDTNRKRSERWFSRVRDNTGATERVDQPASSSDDDFRFNVFPGKGDGSRTVVEQSGGTVDATSALGPADRPARAFDRDLRTAWRFGGDVARDAKAQTLTLRPANPVTADHVTLVQPQGTGQERYLTKARLRLNGGAWTTVDLGPESRLPAGQVVPFPSTRVRTLEVEPLATNLPAGSIDPASDEGPPRNVVGFAEVELDDVAVHETVRLPIDLATRAGSDAADHRLDVVLSRLRYEPGRRDRLDEELALDRRFVLPDARDAAVTGTARVDPNANDTLLDSLLGTTGPGAVYSASGHLAGDLNARASRAFDGDPTTAWIAPYAPSEGQYVAVSLATPVAVNQLDMTVVADGRHPVPTQIRVEGGGRVQSVAVPPIVDSATRNATQTVTVPIDPITASDVRVVIESVRPGMTGPEVTGAPPLPVAIAEVSLANVPRPLAPATIDIPCRSDLLTVNGTPMPVHVNGAQSAARSGLTLTACEPSVALTKGSNTVVTAAGLDTGIDIDQVVLSSGRDGAPAAVTTLGAPLRTSGADVKVVSNGRGKHSVDITTDGKPFWLVLGESYSDGWRASGSGDVCADSKCVDGESQLVNGFANGWLVTPTGAGTMHLKLDFTPQRLVWIGLGVSAFAVVVCLVLVLVGRRRPKSNELASAPELTSPLTFVGRRPSCVRSRSSRSGAGLVAAFVSRWWIGAVVAVAVVIASRVSRGRILLSAGAPLAVVLGRALDVPELGWLAIALLTADVVAAWVWNRHADGRSSDAEPDAPELDPDPLAIDNELREARGVKTADELTTKFRAQGLRVTPQRQAIFRLLHGVDTHPTVDSLYDAARTEMPTISRKTVYQTVHDLESMGEVELLDVGTGSIRVDPNVEHSHQHLVCTRCGTVRDVLVDVADLRVPSRSRRDFTVDAVEVVFRGVCDTCASAAT